MNCARTLTWLAALSVAGCAQQARLQVFRPAAHDLAGIERIAILDFDGPKPDADTAREAVVAQFVENRSYTLVEPALFQADPEAAVSGDRDVALAAARQAGVDAVLQVRLSTADLAGGDGKRQWAAELIDARSGGVVAAGEAEFDAAPERGQIERLAAELVTQLAPHYEEIEVSLARQRWGEGRARVAAGNALARQGEWIAAGEAWEEARQANPSNHAALHNLALLAEARQDYRQAFKLLDQALEQFPARLYHQTRREMEERQTKYLTAVQQVEAIRDAAQAHSGPVGDARAQ